MFYIGLLLVMIWWKVDDILFELRRINRRAEVKDTEQKYGSNPKSWDPLV